MNFIVENWYFIIVAVAVGCCIGVAVARCLGLPRSDQLEKVKEWLLLACTKAEAELGSGTGKLKLPYVYDMFLAKFPWLSKLISFATFAGLVDDALVKMRKLLSENDAAKALVESTEVKISE